MCYYMKTQIERSSLKRKTSQWTKVRVLRLFYRDVDTLTMSSTLHLAPRGSTTRSPQMPPPPISKLSGSKSFSPVACRNLGSFRAYELASHPGPTYEFLLCVLIASGKINPYIWDL